ncbi:glycoside hydrolase family protein [Aeromonas tecta]|uniref:glycoside hydrolase family protein n=1 Tax=Aeromonas tecta TaxID=324617 RepID=UPI0006829AAA|nr:glycoside hydrolase family protein [Aeromonas tecta]
MSSIYALIRIEEGWRNKPYLCTEGYPTVGFGFRIGPKGADINLYQFNLPVRAGEAWLDTILSGLEMDMRRDPKLAMAMQTCERDPARMAVLQSMAYQMGVKGLAAFKTTLQAVIERRWNDAAAGMLNSRWAKQTPNRAKRHAEQMRSGLWSPEYGA